MPLQQAFERESRGESPNKLNLFANYPNSSEALRFLSAVFIDTFYLGRKNLYRRTVNDAGARCDIEHFVVD